jgi:hypothetical protein
MKRRRNFCGRRLHGDLSEHNKSNRVAETILFIQSGCMPSATFQASRWTRGNFLFPTVIEVTDKSVVRHKRSWFSKDEISISIAKIASVHIKTGIIWADILIESTGGSDPLKSHGHKKADARRIREMVETLQGDSHGDLSAGGEKVRLS